MAKACLLLVAVLHVSPLPENTHASFSRKGEKESMELPGRTQGNPDGSLWAADIAHFVQRPVGGRGGEGEL